MSRHSPESPRSEGFRPSSMSRSPTTSRRSGGPGNSPSFRDGQVTDPPRSPGRFTTSTNAFGLASSPTTSTSIPNFSEGFRTAPSAGFGFGGRSETMDVKVSPPRAGQAGTTPSSSFASRRMRRPSLLSLAQTASFGSNGSSHSQDGVRDEEARRATIAQGQGLIYGSSGAKLSEGAGVFDLRSPPSPAFGSRGTEARGMPVPQPRRGPQSRTFGGDSPSIPRWGPSGSFLDAALKRTNSSSPALSFEGLSTANSGLTEGLDDTSRQSTGMDMDDSMQEDEEGQLGGLTRSPLRWVPNHMRPSSSSRKGKARAEESDLSPTGSLSPPSQTSDSGASRNMSGQVSPHQQHPAPPFPLSTGRPLPAPLLATLISETAPLEHEMRSEARLQRLLHSHPRSSPFTPRAPRSSRGRFPDSIDDEDDDQNFRPVSSSGRRTWTAQHAWRGGSRRGSSSDSDSDEGMLMDDAASAGIGGGGNGGVHSAFAAGMDMDVRPGSSSGLSASGGIVHMGPNGGQSGLLTPGHAAAQTGFPTPPPHSGPTWERNRLSRMSFGNAGQLGIASSPGTGLGLPSAFGGLGMGTGTPFGSPTVERLELGASPGALSSASPSLMQYRESSGGSASVRPTKRKAQQEDRFDPYKRPRGTSPSLGSPGAGFSMSPGRPVSAIPIPHSPQHAPFQPSGLGPVPGLTASNLGTLSTTSANRRYSRPLSRSRAASPALSIGSASGVISSSLGSLSGGGQLNAMPGGNVNPASQNNTNGNNNTNGSREHRDSFSLAKAFIPTGQGQNALFGNNADGPVVGGLGSLGLLSLQRGQLHASARTSQEERIAEDRDAEDDAVEMDRRESEGSAAAAAAASATVGGRSNGGSMSMDED